MIRPALDVTVKIIHTVSWLSGDNKRAYLAGVRTAAKIARKLIEADETYAAGSVWGELLYVNWATVDLNALLPKINRYLTAAKFTSYIFPTPDLVKYNEYRMAMQDVSDEMMSYYENLGMGNFPDQEERKNFFFSYLRHIEALMEGL